MFYAMITAQSLFFIWYVLTWPAEKTLHRLFKCVEAGFPIVGSLLRINWLIDLSLLAYGYIIWETILSWIVPSFPIMRAFSFRNIITGRFIRSIKNADSESMKPSLEKPVRQTIITVILAAIAFVFTFIYSADQII